MSQLNSHLFQLQGHGTPECSCEYKTESVEHFIFACPNYSLQREELFGCVREIIGESFARMSPLLKLRLILQGDGLGGEDGCAVAYHFQIFWFAHAYLLPKIHHSGVPGELSGG